MAEIVLHRVTKSCPDGTAAVAAEFPVDGNEFVARVPVHCSVTVERTLQLALDADNVMIVDPRTGENLSVALADA